MNPWITGRIVEQMQHEARAAGQQQRLHREATTRRPVVQPEPYEPRRARVGLAVAKLGLRIAGRHDTDVLEPAFRATPPASSPATVGTGATRGHRAA